MLTNQNPNKQSQGKPSNKRRLLENETSKTNARLKDVKSAIFRTTCFFVQLVVPITIPYARVASVELEQLLPLYCQSDLEFCV